MPSASLRHRSSVSPLPDQAGGMLAMNAAGPAEKLEHLLARIAAERNQAAFAELYAATKGKLFSIVLRIVKRGDIAEEVIQDVYVRIWSNAFSYRPASGSPMTWMIAIARNLAIDVVRKRRPGIYADDSVLLELPSQDPTAVELIEIAEAATEQQQKVLSALRMLDPARRDLVIAAYIHGESRLQLSKRAGVPVNTVKTWIRRALLEVEAILQNTEKENDVAWQEAHPVGRGTDIRVLLRKSTS